MIYTIHSIECRDIMPKTDSNRVKEKPSLDDKNMASGALGLGIVMTILAVVFLILWILEPVFFGLYVIPLIVIILPTAGLAVIGFMMYARYK